MYEAEGDVPVRLNVEKVGIFWSIIRNCVRLRTCGEHK